VVITDAGIVVFDSLGTPSLAYKLLGLIREVGDGAAARDPNRAIADTRHYLAYLRKAMGAAVEETIPFDEVYDTVDWSQFEHLPAFREANRRNALQVYLSMEAESFDQER